MCRRRFCTSSIPTSFLYPNDNVATSLGAGKQPSSPLVTRLTPPRTDLVPLATTARVLLGRVLLTSLGRVGVGGIGLAPALHRVSFAGFGVLALGCCFLTLRGRSVSAGTALIAASAVALLRSIGVLHAVLLLLLLRGSAVVHRGTARGRAIAAAATTTVAAAATAAAAAARASVRGFVDTDSTSVKPDNSVKNWVQQSPARRGLFTQRCSCC